MDEFLPIKSFRVKNFKGIRDSGEVRFTPLTVFIGNNGSGKSSLIEALQTYQMVLYYGIDRAMNHWRGFENIHNPPILIDENQETIENITFYLAGNLQNFRYDIQMRIEFNNFNKQIYISEEMIELGNKIFLHRDKDNILFKHNDRTFSMPSDRSIMSPNSGIHLLSGFFDINIDSDTRINFTNAISLMEILIKSCFISLNSDEMKNPIPLQRTQGEIGLKYNGSNIAEYLLDIRKQSQDAYDGIIESLTVVLPYLKDMQPNITKELERTVYLRMHEDTYTIPQWLLSTGTMRILCLLALFRHPTPPSVIFIEELENGLDPRTIQFIVEEIRSLIVSGKSQVIITTHSPYLLDLLDLSQIVVVERENGETKFSRPADDESLRAWAKKFSPGQLYTMNQLTHQEG